MARVVKSGSWAPLQQQIAAHPEEMRVGPNERFWRRVTEEHVSGCWIWTGARVGDGYGNVRCCGLSQRAHRVAWMIVSGSIPDGLQVLHKCDVRRCVNPAHLFLGTNADNVADRHAKGRTLSGQALNIPVGDAHWMRTKPHLIPRGGARGSAKLTDDEAARAIAMLAEGRLQRDIAAEFGVSQTAISKIRRGLTWRHLVAGEAA